MPEVHFDVLCDKKALMRWARDLLRSHRQELGGGMYMHAEHFEWTLPNQGALDFTFQSYDGGTRMTLHYQETQQPVVAKIESWIQGSGKLRQPEAPTSVAPVMDESRQEPEQAIDHEPEQLFPTNLLQARWDAYTPEERAYATCLFECVRYEHLIRKHLPLGAIEKFEQSNGALVSPTQDLLGQGEGEAPLTEPRRSLGFISGAFATHPEVRPILEACGAYHYFRLLNDFRNALIHVRASGKVLSASAIRKRYRRLQMAISLLQRWPSMGKLYRALQAFHERRHGLREDFGPSADPSRLMRHLGSVGLAGYYGLSPEDAARLEAIGKLFVTGIAPWPEADFEQAVAILEGWQ